MSVFSLLPPEVNSGLMYSGAGSGSLTAAAQAYQSWASELTATASSIQNVISGLDSSFQGPSAAAMTAAVAPYTTWLHGTAGQLSALGAQTAAQAGLYETAHASVINPALIAANRAQLLVLILTNFFGQNAPAIAANEAQYAGYWATDGAAMESYSAGTQANAAAAQQPTAPPLAANAPSTTNPWSFLGNNILNYQLPSGAQNLISHLYPSGTDLGTGTVGSDLSALSTLSNATSDAAGAAGNLSWIQYLSYGAMPLRYLTMLTSFARMGQMGSMGASSLASQATGVASSGPSALMTQIGEFVDGKLQGAVGTLVGHFNTATNAISAKLGHAASMGQLKVPQGWAAAADGMVRAAPVLPNTTVTAPVQTMSATSGMPGGPFGNALMGALAGRGVGSVAAKAPKMIPRSPSAG